MIRSLRWLIFTWSVLMALVTVAMSCTSSPTLSAIDITPVVTSIAPGATMQFKATGKFSDDSTQDITDGVTWSSSDAKIATVGDEIGKKGLATGVANGAVDIVATIDADGIMVAGFSKVTVADADVTLKSIALTPAIFSLAKGTTIDVVATGTYSDGTTKDVTAAAVWSSSDVKIADVLKGFVTAVDSGSADIVAAIGDVKGTAKLTVTLATLAAIDVSNPVGWAPKGMQVQFTATGVFSDESKQDLTKQVQWGSSNASIDISNGPASKGLATAMSEGATTITATLMNVTGTMMFQVTSATLQTIAVTPFNPSIAKGTEVALNATGILSDHSLVNLTPFVAWVSADEKVATFSKEMFAAGVIHGVEQGKVSVSATYLGIAGTTTVTVTGATLSKVSLVPLNPMIAKGTSMGFRAIGTFSDDTAQDLTNIATWGSSNVSVASVSNVKWSHGVAVALAEGKTTISATVGVKSDSTNLTVSPATLAAISVTPSFPSIAKGTSIQMTATGIYSDKTTQDLTGLAVWTSSDASVAVGTASENAGFVTGAGVGSAIVKATFGGVSGATTVTVTNAMLTSIEVTPPNPTIAKGTTVRLEATGVYSDKTTQDLTNLVAWTSSDASVAVSNSMDMHGLAVGQVEGSAVVTATFFGGVAGSTTVTVSAADLVSIAIAPESPTIPKGTQVWFRAIGTYTDNSTQDLTYFASWSSSDASVSVSNELWTAGRATGVEQGSAMISAHFGDFTATTTVTVSAATLVSLAMTPANPQMAKGTAIWLKVTGTYTDATTVDLSAVATWSSSNDAKALVSNAKDTRGLVTAVAQGSANITADFGGMSATTTVTVTAATLSLVTITTVSPTVAKNGTRQLAAIGTFTDNTVQVLTDMVVWVSSDGTKAIVSNAYGSKGLVTGVNEGVVTISALLGSKAGTVQITVTP